MRLPVARTAAPLLVAAALLLCAGCGGGESADGPAGEVVRYTVRGQVVALPSPENPAAEFQVRHEPIPDFKSGGQVVGMRAMTMPFPVGEDVSLDEIAIGDIIELTFETTYSPDTQMVESYRVVSITELPADTELVFTGQASESANDDG
jgi:hypothetical protein